MNLANRYFIDRDIKYLSAKIPLTQNQLAYKRRDLEKKKNRYLRMNKYNPLRLLLNRDIVEIEAWIELHEIKLPEWIQKLEDLKARQQHDR